MLCLLPVQDHSHPRGARGAVLLSSQGPAWPQQMGSCRKQRLIPPHSADRAPETQDHHNLQWKREETSSCHFLHETNELTYPITSLKAASVPSRSYCSAPALPSPIFSFLCSSGSTSLGPGRPQQSLLLGNIAQQHSLKEGQSK